MSAYLGDMITAISDIGGSTMFVSDVTENLFNFAQ